ncbi:MAG: hypothetical protein Q8N18_15655 [Opitutaceae bacterium]|nr:hypothetical protein [Opitutaceae bacterium]
MNLSPEEMTFARDLVKASRQRIHHVAWVDRDGTHRMTALNAAEVGQLNRLSGRLGVSNGELLRQVAYIPNPKPAPAQAVPPHPAPDVAPDAAG